jgi:hypothetical protein
MAEYHYLPIYGVEPWQNNANVLPAAAYGGGAKRTNENFLVSLWTVDSIATPLTPTSGRLLKPMPNTVDAIALDATIPGLGTVGLQTAFDSRTSARFSLQLLDEEAFNFPVLAILNPPQDMKTQYQNAVRASLDPAAPGGIDIKVLRSVLAFNALEAYFQNTDFSSPALGNVTPASILGGILGTMPLAATDGADGVFPTFYNYDNAPNAVASIAAISKGLFFLSALIAPTEGEGFVLTLNWPHTAARG